MEGTDKSKNTKAINKDVKQIWTENTKKASIKKMIEYSLQISSMVDDALNDVKKLPEAFSKEDFIRIIGSVGSVVKNWRQGARDLQLDADEEIINLIEEEKEGLQEDKKESKGYKEDEKQKQSVVNKVQEQQQKQTELKLQIIQSDQKTSPIETQENSKHVIHQDQVKDTNNTTNERTPRARSRSKSPTRSRSRSISRSRSPSRSRSRSRSTSTSPPRRKTFSRSSKSRSRSRSRSPSPSRSSKRTRSRSPSATPSPLRKIQEVQEDEEELEFEKITTRDMFYNLKPGYMIALDVEYIDNGNKVTNRAVFLISSVDTKQKFDLNKYYQKALFVSTLSDFRFKTGTIKPATELLLYIFMDKEQQESVFYKFPNLAMDVSQRTKSISFYIPK
jgi:hypothetical protein